LEGKIKLKQSKEKNKMSSRIDEFQQSLMIYPKAGWRKWMFKAPLNLWRLGLGPVLGQYLLVLTHKGRKSGRIYHTMVEYHELNENIYIPVAFGPQTDWYQNISAHPQVTVQTANGSESRTAVRVTDDQEILDVFAYFLKRDPPLTKIYLKTLGIEPEPDDVIAKKDKIYWVRLEHVPEPALLPLEVDLAWVWLAAAGFLFALLSIGRKKK
jgi:deazaflavin-dependent oxidoreductase (nitroreductase family)